MKIKSIQTKVLLMLLLLTLVVVAVMSFMMRHGVDRQFDLYKKELDDTLNFRVVSTLQELYKEDLNWDKLQDNPQVWARLLVQSAMEVSVSSGDGGIKDIIKSQDYDERRKLRRLIPQFSLVDQQMKLIVGVKNRSFSEYIKTPVVYQKQEVGYLLTAKYNKKKNKADQVFNEKIRQFLVTMALVLFVLVSIASVPIARSFTQPIRAINKATKQAAAGDYTVRTDINRVDEMGQLGQNFNLLASTLESNTEVHKKMMADISHELRTPVAVLLAEVEAIQDGIHQADEKNLQLLHQQIISLKLLINDLHQLSVTDLGSLQYQMHPVNIQSVISTALKAQKLTAQEKQLTLKFEQHKDIKQQVLGDETRLLQMMNNLLNNATAYTDEGGVVKVDVSFVSKSNEFIIKIEDSKPGLSPHEMEQIFDRLYRKESSRNKSSGGSGLGLAIVKNIVEAHNGSVGVQASELGGICMTVRLPGYV